MADGDRILGNLPPIFAGLPRPTVLASLADAFGGELVSAENSLAAMMVAHWVQFADINADDIDDLSRIGALYGLLPRDDETVEGFRAHLLRYVRTYLEGTTTVRGILRITADALGIVIADDQLDTWWDRPAGGVLATPIADGADAAEAMLGFAAGSVRGAPARPARFAGSVDLAGRLDLRATPRLSLTVSGAAAVVTDLAAITNLAGLVTAIGAIPGIAAEASGGLLVIETLAAGAAASLTLDDIDGDAVPALLGIAPHEYTGRDPMPARITGAVDLQAVLDLSQQRYLRLTVDGATFEIDCAGTPANATALGGIVIAINTDIGATVAALVGGRLVLSSPTPGLDGSIAVRPATCDDVSAILLGDALAYARGANAAPARVSGVVDLSGGVDLSQRRMLALAIDGMAPRDIDCAGPDPARTGAGDIVTAINTAFGAPVASRKGSTLTLSSIVVGAAGRVRLLTAASGDALCVIFGFAPRTATGTDAAPARLAGTVDLSGTTDLRARQRLRVAIDDATPVTVDFAATDLDLERANAAGIAGAINAAIGTTAASIASGRLVLSSAQSGAQGAVAVLPIESVVMRPFVSRAFPAEEASNTVLGVYAAEAVGTEAVAGQVTGAAELHDGIDLRVARFLRIAIDGGAPVAIDCASASRPRAVLLAELVQALNSALAGAGVASADTGRLVIESATTGLSSAVSVLPGGGDGTDLVFGGAPRSAAGQAAARVTFTGTRDLSKPIDLSSAGHVRIAIDGAAPVEIDCAGASSGATSAAEIVRAINAGLGGTYASTDGTVLRIASAVAGASGGIAFLAPATSDATRLVFGIAPGRTYQGQDPSAAVLAGAAAVLAGAAALPATPGVAAAPFIRLSVDGGAGVLIDLRANAATPDGIARSITDGFAAAAPAVAPVVASVVSRRIVLTAASSGPGSRLALLPVADFDAAAVLLGAATVRPGQGAVPARLVGSVDVRQPVDLSRRPVLRLAVDGGRSVDIDISGPAPDATLGEQIAALVNVALPGTASIDDDGHLVLTAATAGPESRLSVPPLRAIEVIDYPASMESVTATVSAQAGAFRIINDGASDSRVSFTVAASAGAAGFTLINRTSGLRIDVMGVVSPGDMLTLGCDGDVLTVRQLRPDGSSSLLPPGVVQASPAVETAVAPFVGARPLGANGPGARDALALIDVLAPNAVVVEAKGRQPVSVAVTQASASAASPPPVAITGAAELTGRLSAGPGAASLLDGNGAVLATLRAGAGVRFAPFDGVMVAVRGQLYSGGAAPLLVSETISCLFDVMIGVVALDAVTIDSRFPARSLAARITALPGATVLARDFSFADALTLPRGVSDWTLVAGDGARFDAARFDRDRYPGTALDEVGVFDVSRFDSTGPAHSTVFPHSHFAPFGDPGPMTVTATWDGNRAGGFRVNLPDDLPAVFGGRFNVSRFTSNADAPEVYHGVVFEPVTDTRYLGAILPIRATPSPLVYAQPVAVVPLGWEPQTVPFARPRKRFLSGGRADRSAAIYLAEAGVPGFIGIFAIKPGQWGDEIAVSVRYAGPALFDLSVTYAGARFECAREIVYAGRVLAADESALPGPAADIVTPAPAGIVRAKAAGIAAAVTRDRT